MLLVLVIQGICKHSVLLRKLTVPDEVGAAFHNCILKIIGIIDLCGLNNCSTLNKTRSVQVTLIFGSKLLPRCVVTYISVHVGA